MSEDIELEEELTTDESAGDSRYAKLINEGEKKYKLPGMYKDWFLDYASYVILERAVPHIDDGLKPVQRRILHAMKRIDDGRYNKVANIIGHTMQYHPHGDASIGDALVQLGQKDLLIDTQGNWGNILTGDSAAAPRYIEARLTAFAGEVVFNPKTTEWMDSYDGRNREPVTLPVKFPLLLAQGVEGIAVGLASKILPHNFNELIDAAIAHLKGKDFELFPDFPTGGLADCTRYNDGIRGGVVKVRARINKVDKKTVVITDIPYGKTTSSIIESILKANDKGKIKIRKVDDNTSQNVEIVVHLHNDVSPDKTIDALYAFTDCEVSISPNACVIQDDKPHFIGVKTILRHNAEHTKNLLQQELQIRLAELHEDWHYSSLEKIFFEERIYRELESNAKSWDAQLAAVRQALQPFEKKLRNPITPENVAWLVEKPVRKISKFDLKAADERIKNIESEVKEVENNLSNLVDYTVNYFRQLKKKYGKNFERKTELRNFETIEATQVVAANAKLYVNRAEGFVGMELKRDEQAEYVSDCSDIDEIIVFLRNGKYIITKVQEKAFVGKDVIHVAVFKRNDERTIYNAAYRDGKNGQIFVKRFFVSGITRDKEYDLTQGKEGSQTLWFSANPNGEAEILKVYLKPRPKLKKTIFEFDFGQLAIKGRASMGNLLTRYPIHKIMLKEKGESTLGGQQIWFDTDIQRLNTDRRGLLLGEFHNGERIVAITKKGTYYTTGYDLSNRYDGELLRIEKFDSRKIFSMAYYEAEQKAFYIKRFTLEPSDAVPQSLTGEHPGSYLIELSEDRFPQAQLTFKGKQAHRPPETIDVDAFIGIKSFRAKGKRVTTYDVNTIEFIEPLEKEAPAGTPPAGRDGEAVQMSLL
ncbi:MAG: DNA gyrase/topoisomerase IV subunit A [Prevotellaceae bacterium]|jgi:topoisomerase-4 subunit A|nr:DNA gyrase/topoisomerase IV subunit A [Prevotellaceae bacterium]